MNRYSTEDDRDLRDARDSDRVLSEAGLDECTEFAQSARSSPQDLRAFLLDNAISVELVGLDANREFDLERLIAEVIRTNRRSWLSPATPRY